MNLETEVNLLRKDVDRLQEDVARVQSMIETQGKELMSVDKALAVMSENLTHIRQGQDKLNQAFSKVFWAVVIILVGAATNWILKGGLVG